MESLAALYKNHIVTLQERTRDVLARFQMDALLIHSGELVNVFLDDHPYPFKVNPQFKAWVPVTQVPNCWLLVDGVNKPKLWFYLPVAALLALWMARGKLAAFARAGQVLLAVVATAAAVVLGLALFQVRPEHLRRILTAKVPSCAVLDGSQLTLAFPE